MQDDTQGEIQTQIGSDHQASMLSMGYMVRVPDAGGRREKRGEGFELGTDGWGAVRAGAGLLITTEARHDAQGHHKALAETAARLKNGEDIQRTLGEGADLQRALDGEQLKVADTVRAQHDGIKGSGEQGELSQPALVLASPVGIAAAAGEHIHLHRSFADTSRLSASRRMRMICSSVNRFFIEFSMSQGYENSLSDWLQDSSQVRRCMRAFMN
ncbi:hypothetical protein D3C81_1340530 [compost metagenome]